MTRRELLRQIVDRRRAAGARPSPPLELSGWPLERLKREYVREVLRQTGGHRGRTAGILGIAPRTLYSYLQREEEGTEE